MFRITFNKSQSKHYNQAVKLAKEFYQYTFADEKHSVDISVKELFEKWDFFNKLFWIVGGWKGSTFGYDDYDLHSVSDKKRLFYSLQTAHSKWLCLSEMYLKHIGEAYFDSTLENEIRDEVFNEEDVDRILDLLLAEKHRQKYKTEFNPKGNE